MGFTWLLARLLGATIVIENWIVYLLMAMFFSFIIFYAGVVVGFKWCSREEKALANKRITDFVEVIEIDYQECDMPFDPVGVSREIVNPGLGGNHE